MDDAAKLVRAELRATIDGPTYREIISALADAHPSVLADCPLARYIGKAILSRIVADP